MEDEDATPAGLPPAPIGPDPEPREDTPTDRYEYAPGRERGRCDCATVADLYLCAAVLAALQLLCSWAGYVFR